MNKVKFAGILASVIMGVVNMSALDVYVEQPGTVRDLIDDASAVTSLTVKGVIDATDLYFIGGELPSLKSLNLSGAEIAGCSGASVNGFNIYSADVIPQGAFAGSPVENIAFPTGKNLIIGDGAFMGSALTSVRLLSNVDSIGVGAFANCNSLADVAMPGCRIGAGAFADCPSLTKVSIGSNTSLPASTFRNCVSLAQITGSEYILSIGDMAFQGDKALKDFVFGARLNHIGKDAFASTGLSDAFLEKSVQLTTVGARAFAGSDISQIKLPVCVNLIADGAFMNTCNLDSIEIPTQAVSIGKLALARSAAGKVILSNAVEYIDDYAMADMTGLETVDVLRLDAVPELGEDVWHGVDQESVTLKVYLNMSEDYASADQWNKFTLDIEDGFNGVGDAYAAHYDVSSRFRGTELLITSGAYDMASVRIYDVAAHLLTTVTPFTDSVAIETASLPGNIFIISVTLRDGSVHSLKLARN